MKKALRQLSGAAEFLFLFLLFASAGCDPVDEESPVLFTPLEFTATLEAAPVTKT